MFSARRRFLSLLAFAGTVAMLNTRQLAGQARPQGGRPSGTGSDPNGGPENSEATPEKSPTKALLEANEKDIKKNIEKLFQLATDLKEEVEKTDSSQILSLALLKKADEIEKLAHDIKTRAKG
jgi:hypothetical protein